MRVNKIFKYFEGSVQEVKYQIALFESEHNVVTKEGHYSYSTNPAWATITFSVKEK